MENNGIKTDLADQPANGEVAQKVIVKLKVMDETITVKIHQDDEILMRKAAKLINDKAAAYMAKNPNVDSVSLLAAIALNNTVKLLKENEENNI